MTDMKMAGHQCPGMNLTDAKLTDQVSSMKLTDIKLKDMKMQDMFQVVEYIGLYLVDFALSLLTCS